MRLLLSALVVTAGVAAPPPPTIHEPFAASVLPCPRHPVATLDLEGCAEQRLLASDRAIDARVRTIYALLRSSGARADFVRGERAWLSYRRASCSAESSVEAGGSGRPVLFATCEVARNRTHLAELAQLLRVHRVH